MKVTNHVGLNRVIEIAMIENQPLTILVGSGDSNINIVDLLKDKEKIENDFKEVVNFTTYKNFTDALSCEITEPPFDWLTRKWESFDEVLTRVENARKIVVDDFLCDSSKQLLKTAYTRLGFTENKYNKVIQTAKNIAKLDNSNRIGVQHIAEAIQYFSIDYNDYHQTLIFQFERLKSEIKHSKKLIKILTK